MQAALNNVVEVLKVVMPWVTGGLAGAVLGYFLNQRVAARARPRLLVTYDKVNYTLPKREQAFKDLRVSFNGTAYDRLVYHELEVANVSQRNLAAAAFVVDLGEGSTVLRERIDSEPIRLEVAQDQAGLEVYQRRYVARELNAGDSVKIRLLVEGGETLKWYYRGPEEARVVSSQSVAAPGAEALKSAMAIIVSMCALTLSWGALTGGAEFVSVVGIALLAVVFSILMSSRWRAQT